jgi:hypothetical protein
MAPENKESYYSQAITWGEKYLCENKEAQSFKVKLGEIITDDLFFVSVQVERIKHNVGREKQGAYNRLREFKQFYEKIKENSLLDKLI